MSRQLEPSEPSDRGLITLYRDLLDLAPKLAHPLECRLEVIHRKEHQGRCPCVAAVHPAGHVRSCDGGERILDVACGTGNATLVAHRAGASVTGLDASPSLLSVARGRVPDAAFVAGDAVELPFDDGEFDGALSVFGVIFARPADRAAAEITRVVRPGGRVAITTWPPRGPLFAAVSLLRQAIARHRAPEGPPAVDWGDPSVLAQLLGPYGELSVIERQLAHNDATPEEVWERWEGRHPMWIGARGLLEPAGEWDLLRHASIAALRAGGIGARATSPYLLAVLRRS